MYRRWHLIGLEVGISVAASGRARRGDRVRDRLARRCGRHREEGSSCRERPLDGEGGYTVGGKLMTAADSRAKGCLPIGLAHGWKLLEPVAASQPLRWSDVAFDASSTAVRLRREMVRISRLLNDRSSAGVSAIYFWWLWLRICVVLVPARPSRPEEAS